MTPDAVRAELARLRDAGRALRGRPGRDTHEALASWLDTWSDAASPWHEELAARLPGATGLAPATVREGLARGLEPYNGKALRALQARELGDAAVATGFDTTATLLAGVIPMPAFVAVLAPLVLRSPVLVKPGAHDRVTPDLLARTLAEVDAELGACVGIADVRRGESAALDALCEADCVVASGSDAAVAEIARRVAPPQRLVPYGHRVSLAVLGPEATRGAALEGAAHGLALDVALWDQLGCLSPVAVWVADADAAGADRVADALASALAQAEHRLPRGEIGAAAGEAISRARAEAEMRAAGGADTRLLAPSGTAWTVVREADSAPRPAPLHRFVRVHPVPDVAGALRALRPLARHLAGIAVAGFGADTHELAHALATLGASRICPPGTLQTPPLAWHHDGRGVLPPLARFSDLEVGVSLGEGARGSWRG